MTYVACLTHKKDRIGSIDGFEGDGTPVCFVSSD